MEIFFIFNIICTYTKVICTKQLESDIIEKVSFFNQICEPYLIIRSSDQ